MPEKTPLLLLPGLLCDEAFWRSQVEALADVCAPRVMAYGLLDDFGAMAEAVLAQAPPRFALAGHSMGGRVALEIMRRAPERVLKLALLATDYRGLEDGAARTAEEGRRKMMLERVRSQGMEAFARMWTTQILPAERLTDQALVDEVVAMMVRQPAGALAAQTHAALMRVDNAELLAAIACPTLLVAGRLDLLRPVEVHEQMAARIPRSRLVVVEDAAHMVAMERPEAVTAALRAWLTET
jgi:pimeloyl-ACP methyl ester carboxylesterase